jgi:hypothetical protein
MTTDPNRCPVCQCETFAQVADEWCPVRDVYYVTYRCADHGHAWSGVLAMAVRTVHENGVDRDLVFLAPR